MNLYLMIAGLLCIVLGVVHSLLGEISIFRGSVAGRISTDGTLNRLPYQGIIWATWHLASVFGWGIGALLIKLSFDEQQADFHFLPFMYYTIAGSMFIGSVLVLIGTRGKHPGWIVLLGISILTCIGNQY